MLKVCFYFFVILSLFCCGIGYCTEYFGPEDEQFGAGNGNCNSFRRGENPLIRLIFKRDPNSKNPYLRMSKVSANIELEKLVCEELKNNDEVLLKVTKFKILNGKDVETGIELKKGAGTNISVRIDGSEFFFFIKVKENNYDTGVEVAQGYSIGEFKISEKKESGEISNKNIIYTPRSGTVGKVLLNGFFNDIEINY